MTLYRWLYLHLVFLISVEFIRRRLLDRSDVGRLQRCRAAFRERHDTIHGHYVVWTADADRTPADAPTRLPSA